MITMMVMPSVILVPNLVKTNTCGIIYWTMQNCLIFMNFN